MARHYRGQWEIINAKYRVCVKYRKYTIYTWTSTGSINFCWRRVCSLASFQSPALYNTLVGILNDLELLGFVKYPLISTPSETQTMDT